MSDRVRRLSRFAPGALVLALAVAWLVPEPAWIRLATPDVEAAQGMDAAIDGLADGSEVLVGFDPDLGTYAEVRPTARAVIDDLLARDVVLSLVSLTPEGRALAVAEIERLRRGGLPPERIVDLGFVAGAEPGWWTSPVSWLRPPRPPSWSSAATTSGRGAGSSRCCRGSTRSRSSH